jgi:hypothetical protein
MENLTLELDRDTSEAIKTIARAVHASDEAELVRDAVNTFRWIVQRQNNGYKIAVYKGEYEHPEDIELLVNLSEKEKAA